MARASGRRRWTDDQARAISTAGRTVLVSASAGTGKTAVLTERVTRLLADATNPIDTSSLLVVTFTEAAAEEMKARIAARLREAYAHAPSRQQASTLYGQLLRLDAAQISTIHAFCKRTIEEHFQVLGLDPAWRIIEPDAARILKQHVLDEVIEAAWQDPRMGQALEILLGGGSGGVDRILRRVIDLSEFLDARLGRAEWFERAAYIGDLAAHAAPTDADRCAYLRGRLERALGWCRYGQQLNQRLAGGHWQAHIEERYTGPVEQWLGLLDAGCWDDCVARIAAHDFGRFPNRPKDLDKARAEQVKKPLKKAADAIKALKGLSLFASNYQEKVGPRLGLPVRMLIELTRQFDAAWAQAKLQRGVLDFADLEQRMLELLDRSEEVVESLRRRFRWVFVDEVQDINAVQQRLLDRISRPDNVFIVGDVKQSIYGFRQSRPELFIERLSRALPAEQPLPSGIEGPPPMRVDLRDSFRSRPAVLDFANRLFGRIMTQGVAGVDYDERAVLRAPHGVPDGDGPAVEMVVLDEQPNDEPTADDGTEGVETGDDTEVGENGDTGRESGLVVSARQRQAAYIARRIRAMVEGESGPPMQIRDPDTGDLRPVRYGDIAVLLRSPAKRARDYVEVLRLAGIPVSSDSSEGFFAATEVADMMALLKTLDNPRGDIELAAVLRSEMIGLEDADLARVRLEAPTQVGPRLYDAACWYARGGPDAALRQRVGEALERLGRWRRAARTQSLADLVWDIYRETGYLAFVSALPGGRQRRANLLMLHDRAVQFERSADAFQGRSLAHFIESVEQLLEAGQDWAPAAADTAENAVRILSVHRSKGLEFGIVFLAELNQPFNREDTIGPCQFDEDLLVGLQVWTDRERCVPSREYELIADRHRTRALAEEMRILYVAVTRAREHLVLCASRKRDACAEALAQAPVEGRVDDWLLHDANCALDWVLWGLADEPRVRRLFGLEPPAGKALDCFEAHLVAREELDDLARRLLADRDRPRSLDAPPDGPETAEARPWAAGLCDRLRWRYPHEPATHLQAKYSVTDLTHRNDEFAPAGMQFAVPATGGLRGRQQPEEMKSGYPSPGTWTTEAPQRRAAQRVGTATHRVIEELPLPDEVTDGLVHATIKDLVRRCVINADDAAAIDVEAIVGFFTEDPGRLACDRAHRILREWPFTMGLDAGRLAPEAADEVIVVQGIVDMIVRTPAGLVVIDFKTDRIAPEQPAFEARLAAYREQIEHYCHAAEACLDAPVTGAYLHFLHPRLSVRIRPA